MSRNTKFIWCLLTAMLFCAITYGGCGGSDNLASVNNDTSGDTSGRQADGWDDVEVFSVFNDLNGSSWKVDSIEIEGLSFKSSMHSFQTVNFSVSNLAADGESAVLTAENADLYDKFKLNVMITNRAEVDTYVPFIASGKYQRYGTILISDVLNNSYCMIDLPNLVGPWTTITVKNTVYVPALSEGGSFVINTTLVKQ